MKVHLVNLQAAKAVQPRILLELVFAKQKMGKYVAVEKGILSQLCNLSPTKINTFLQNV